MDTAQKRLAEYERRALLDVAQAKAEAWEDDTAEEVARSMREILERMEAAQARIKEIGGVELGVRNLGQKRAT